MKRSTLPVIALLLFILIQSFTQSTQNERAKDEFPVLIDSAKFILDLKASRDVNNLYCRLKKEQNYATYKYSFKITSNGNVAPGIYGDEALITKFIKSHFNKYKWKPSKRNKVNTTGYGSLDINLIPSKKLVQIEISMSDGSFSPNLKIKTVFQRTIPMN